MGGRNVNVRYANDTVLFCYLGSYHKEDGRYGKEMKRKIVEAKMALQMRNILTNKYLPIKTRRVVKTYVWYVLLYGLEA